MPKVVDHQARRIELAEAVWQVIARDGIAEVSVRAVAAAAGWSTGTLGHYFRSRADLVAFAAELVVERVTERVVARLQDLPTRLTPIERARALLVETMPGDPERFTESSIAFAFLALGLRDPRLAAIQQRHFGGMYDLCRTLVHDLASHGAPLAGSSPDSAARRLHAVVDGLSVHVLAGHLTAEDMATELDAHLATLASSPG
ncbi:TetR family transcriptional regulator [Nonomuraea fuscirosea]|uniref:TetR family transcriptional regulator n=1 Tax=Nonomuraea fuscirosea TaxID=1291556 RepID=A0A2T0LXN1_9ACTN|nr:TetR family transcriptional regulator C-terminal domain-containing protein [Nonomuraea fuscirosea]PRX48782.1 TetR family transcriptional regulator [Nonomuraea fuscirosea]